VAPERWQQPGFVVFSMALHPPAASGEGLLLLLNGSGQAQQFALPATTNGEASIRYRLLCDSAQPALEEQVELEIEGHRTVMALSQTLLAYRDPLA
jgi:hypothetical protein